MTAPAIHDERGRRLRHTVARLALGLPVSPAHRVEWQDVYRTCVEEGCTVLAWLRSGSLIRDLAPHDVTLAWRDHVARAVAGTERKLALIAAGVGRLESEGIDALVLKGLPLAMRLYGELAARECADIDLFIPIRDRHRAHEVLGGLGWRHLGGSRLWVDSYVHRGDESVFLEVHSSLVWPALEHLPTLEPTAARWKVASIDLPVLDGPVLPVYLAANIAKHRRIRLRSWVDFEALWASLEPMDRARSEAVASRALLRRTLEWARDRTTQFSRMAERSFDGGSRAFEMLRGGLHPYTRAVLLSESLGTAWLTAWAAAWPRPERHGLTALAHVLARRARLPLRSLSFRRQRRRGSTDSDVNPLVSET